MVTIIKALEQKLSLCGSSIIVCERNENRKKGSGDEIRSEERRVSRGEGRDGIGVKSEERGEHQGAGRRAEEGEKIFK